jgi:chorismate synthase
MRYLSGGESHGPCLTAVIEGLPSGLTICAADIDFQLERRQKGYGRGPRMMIEKDRVEVLSGLRFNRTIGSPLTLQVKNSDWQNWQDTMSPEGEEPSALEKITRPRPGHADLAGGLKYKYDDLRLALERSSARETAIRVAVGSVGRILLGHFGVRIYSQVCQIGKAATGSILQNQPEIAELVESSPVRCADQSASEAMIDEIKKAAETGDTLGGVIELLVTGVPPGLGSYVHWDRRLDGRLARALVAIPAIKGVEFGLGFAAAGLRGSEVHDPIVRKEGQVDRPTNHAGGIEGGISNGKSLRIKVAMKPIPTMSRALPSVDWITGEVITAAVERADVCAVPAAAVVAEASVAWELAVAFLEKFSGDYLEEVEAAFRFYINDVRSRLVGEGEWQG